MRARRLMERVAGRVAGTAARRRAAASCLLALLLGATALAGCARPPASVALPPAQDVVFVVPHEDDESLFAGELIARYVASGAHVKLIYGTVSAGGTLATTLPAYAQARRAALAEVLTRLPGVEVTTAPIPDGSAMSTGRKTRALARFLRRPGMIPRDATVFTIGGSGNSDHVDTREDVLSLMRRRRRPVYLYWGYGADHAVLDPARVGTPVTFAPSSSESAFKRWAIGVYDRVVYRDPRFVGYRPRIMDSAGDDVVTVVAAGRSPRPAR